jgi:hypothetical protein
MSVSALCLLALLAAGPPPDEVRGYIPNGIVTARVMEVAFPPRAAELTGKFQAAISLDREWWLEYVRSAPEGAPLPYHERMGMTEAEYEEYLELAARPTLQQTAEARISFGWEGDSVVVITETEPIVGLGELKLDLRADTVQSSYGELATRSEINNTASDSPTGPWQGVEWKLERMEDEPLRGVVASLSLGRLARSREGILYFTAKEIGGGELVRASRAILFYPLP